MKTNVAETSIDCYYNRGVQLTIKDHCGKIAAFMLNQSQPMTRREIGKALGLESNQYSGRCNQLIAAKVLAVCGEKVCSYSGKRVEALIHSCNLDKQARLFQ